MEECYLQLVPGCSNCGYVLDSVAASVDYDTIEDKTTSAKFSIRRVRFDPCKCPNCNSRIIGVHYDKNFEVTRIESM